MEEPDKPTILIFTKIEVDGEISLLKTRNRAPGSDNITSKICELVHKFKQI